MRRIDRDRLRRIGAATIIILRTGSRSRDHRSAGDGYKVEFRGEANGHGITPPDQSAALPQKSALGRWRLRLGTVPEGYKFPKIAPEMRFFPRRLSLRPRELSTLRCTAGRYRPTELMIPAPVRREWAPREPLLYRLRSRQVFGERLTRISWASVS